MALKVIGAGLGRNATFSLKFALEHIGFGPCYHMSELFAGARRTIPLWVDVVEGRPDWDAVFEGFQSVTDYPACTYWRELTTFYPEAKVVLTTRDPDKWFDSVMATIFAPEMRGDPKGSPVERMLHFAVFEAFGDKVEDRAWMTDWYVRRNREVVDRLPAERLLSFNPADGWAPLCEFLGADVPEGPFPRVNSRDELGGELSQHNGLPPDPGVLEPFMQNYIEELRAKAFAS